MCLGISANGWADPVNQGSHVGVAIYMMKGEFDTRLKWAFEGAITTKLVNQKEGGEGYMRVINI